MFGIIVDLNASFPIVQERGKQNVELYTTLACQGGIQMEDKLLIPR